MTDVTAPTPTRLTELLGRRVHLADGRWGRVQDLVADLGRDPVLVTAVVVRRGRDQRRVPWSLASPTAGHLLLARATEALVLDDHELLLRRDVLDTLVFDGRLHVESRVGEVWLAARSDGNLELTGIQTGVAALWQRLTAHHRPPRTGQVLPITRVHLTAPRAHTVQLALPRSWIGSAPHQDLAALLTRLPVARAVEAVEHLSSSRVAEAVATMHPQPRARLHRALRGPAPGEQRRTRRTSGWRSHHRRSIVR